jgi:type I restriction enzyme R subunit
VYESTSIITRFTDGFDPNPRAREVFGFLRPETLADAMQQVQRGEATLRERLQHLPELNIDGLRACQIKAITNLEASLKQTQYIQCHH